MDVGRGNRFAVDALVAFIWEWFGLDFFFILNFFVL